ncbi:MAG TPA: cupredoxin domain-containing protein [Caldimonas sp.]
MAARLSRRTWLGAAALLLASLGARRVAGQAQPRTIRIVAHKFEYEPSQIALKKGEPVILELTSNDVTMGFSSVDFKLRTDIIPGQWTKLALTPDRSGEFIFFCDVFCGNGHEEMEGKLLVSE